MLPHFTPNLYRIQGDIVYIALTSRQRITVAETLIDVDDLDTVIRCGRWHLHKTDHLSYAATHGGTKRTTLHRLIMQPTEGLVVHHKNHNALDNRRANLDICTSRENSQLKALYQRRFEMPTIHTLEAALSVYKQVYQIADDRLDRELAQLRSSMAA